MGKNHRLTIRKRRGPTHEIAKAYRLDQLRLPKYVYATKGFVKQLRNSKIAAIRVSGMELALLLDRLGYRNAVAEYCAEKFAKTGKIPLEGDCTYDAIAKWAEPKLKVIRIEPKRPKRRDRTESEQKVRDKGNAYSRKIQGILAEGYRRGEIEVELRGLLAKAKAKREG